MVMTGIFIPGGILRNGLPAAPTNRVQWNLAGITYDPYVPYDQQQNITQEIGDITVEKEVCGKLKVATLNIQDGRNNRLNAALRCMKQMNIDMGILTETKFSNDKYTKAAEGYTVVGTITDGNKGGVALFYRDGADGWTLESIKSFGANVIRATLVSGQKRWYIIGAYIPPSEEDGGTLDAIAAAGESTNQRWPIILLGDLNCNLDKPEGNSIIGAERRMETATLMSTLGLSNMMDRTPCQGQTSARPARRRRR